MRHVKFDKELGHMVLLSCSGQKCGMCGAPSTHKVGQDEDEAVSVVMVNDIETAEKEMLISHHPFTQYVCCKCFKQIMGWAVQCGK